MKISAEKRRDIICDAITSLANTKLNMSDDRGSAKFAFILGKLSNGTLASYLREEYERLGIAPFALHYDGEKVLDTAATIERMQNMNCVALEIALDLAFFECPTLVLNFKMLREYCLESMITEFDPECEITSIDAVTVQGGTLAVIIGTWRDGCMSYYDMEDLNRSFKKAEYALLHAMFGKEFYLAAKTMYITKQLMDQNESE